jgi:hypothetical protein
MPSWVAGAGASGTEVEGGPEAGVVGGWGVVRATSVATELLAEETACAGATPAKDRVKTIAPSPEEHDEREVNTLVLVARGPLLCSPDFRAVTAFAEHTSRIDVRCHSSFLDLQILRLG